MIETARGLQSRDHQVFILAHPESRVNQSNFPGLHITRRIIGPDFNPIAIMNIVSLIKKHRIQLVVANIEKEISVGGVAARICGVPLIRRVGRDDDFKNRWKYRFIQKHLVDHNIIPAKIIYQLGKERMPGLEEEDFTIIHNGRNRLKISEKEKEKIKALAGIPLDVSLIGTTVMLSWIKNVEGLISAFSMIQKEIPMWHLVVAGEGPDRSRLQELVYQSGVHRVVHFPGFQSDAIRFSSIYDIAVLNSLNEGFPNTVVEYFATGRPVIATKVGGTPELVENGETGLLVEPGAQDQLEEALLKLTMDQQLAMTLGNQAMKVVEKRFSATRMFDELEVCFNNIVNENTQS